MLSHREPKGARRVPWYRLAPLLLACVPALAIAQGRITGRVILPGGSAAAAARVLVQGTTLAASADRNGEFELVNVPPGTYTIRATRLGYPPVSAQVVVTSGATTVINLALPQDPTALTMVSAAQPIAPLSPDSITLTVPDSAILQRRQAEAIGFTLRTGERGVLALFDTVTLTVQVVEAVRTPTGVNARGTVVGADGTMIGSFVVVVRNNNLTANIRPGLRLFQITPQPRGIVVITEVDLSKLPGPKDGDAAAGFASHPAWRRFFGTAVEASR